MRTNHCILGLLTLISIGFMGFLFHNSYADNSACDKTCPLQKEKNSTPDRTVSGPEEPSITHMIASV